MTNATPRVYPTLACDLNCGYCSNGHDLAVYDELTAGQWAERIHAMGSEDVVFSGGEPTLYSGFYELVGLLAKTVHMVVYTNAAQPLDMVRLNEHAPRMTFRCSCHAQTPEDAADWTDNVRAIHNAGYSVTGTTVHCPPRVVEALRSHGVVVDTPQRLPQSLAPPVRCTIDRHYYAPDGTRYHCVGKLVKADPSGIVEDDAPASVTCHTPDQCALCDGLTANRVPIQKEMQT